MLLKENEFNVKYLTPQKMFLEDLTLSKQDIFVTMVCA